MNVYICPGSREKYFIIFYKSIFLVQDKCNKIGMIDNKCFYDHKYSHFSRTNSRVFYFFSHNVSSRLNTKKKSLYVSWNTKAALCIVCIHKYICNSNIQLSPFILYTIQCTYVLYQIAVHLCVIELIQVNITINIYIICHICYRKTIFKLWKLTEIKKYF